MKRFDNINLVLHFKFFYLGSISHIINNMLHNNYQFSEIDILNKCKAYKNFFLNIIILYCYVYWSGQLNESKQF